MNVYFLTDRKLPNYLEDSDFYSYMCYDDILNHNLRKKLFDFNFTGKYIHSVYPYWLCRNSGIEAKLILNTENLPKDSIVFFHYDMQHLLKNFSNFTTVQILADRPIIPNVNYYTCCSKLFLNSNKLKNCFYLPEPIPAKNLLSMPNNSNKAKTFRFLGLRKNFPEFLTDNLLIDLKKEGIFIRKDFGKVFLEQDDDVIFFLRKENDFLYNKHTNRVKLSYLNESPYIGTLNDDEKNELVKQEDVINISYDKDSLIDAFMFLKNDDNFLKIKNNLKIDKSFYLNEWIVNMKNILTTISSQTQ